MLTKHTPVKKADNPVFLRFRQVISSLGVHYLPAVPAIRYAQG
jgi:hypothetical protein